MSKGRRAVKAAGMVVVAIVSFPSGAGAQRSWGMAATSDGTLYFCDIQRDRVWQYSATGGLTLMLDHNHCHTMVMGYDGKVYGENVGGETRAGSAVGVWELDPGRKPQFLMGPAEKPDASVWVVRDAAGNGYSWNGDREARKESQILKRSPQGVAQVLAGGEWGFADGPGDRARFGEVAAMAAERDGTLYLVDSGNLRRIAPDGMVSTLVSGFVSTTYGGVPGVPGLYNHHFGMALDGHGGVFVVDFRHHRILRWDQAGTRVTFESGGLANWLTQRNWGWTVTGVAVGDSLCVMEYWPMPTAPAELIGNPRIRKISADGKRTTLVSVSNSVVRATAVGIVAALVVLLWRLRRYRR